MRWSLRNDDDDGSENGKRAIGLDKQNNVARASRFFVHFSAVVARLLRARGWVLPYMGYINQSINQLYLNTVNGSASWFSDMPCDNYNL